MSNSNFVLSIIVASACLMSCTDETIVQNIIRGDQVRVSGEVKAWRCGVSDWMNNHSIDHRFAVETGDTGQVAHH